ncbi:regulatory protein, FmdB family [Thermodesulfatator indicus DSM 15286]|uniref:Regulatory protein, FmdB family n=1 Tax=Thermodesulfatator indicus (strain DSM 15286 / JCM 11887 / CIR29812) TaxID=667014 RepID=F8AD73_THEID|nr:FmdB family zinc ribbon protein [Thermodesulfatator indicus]AEH44805.1 regulatory protein, FmdB family [Thermodesulfatator indicus DSM 15286]
MPIYEYECENCGRHYEVWQKITDEPLTTCEACQGKLRKLVSQSSFILKGSGWYVTDYARKEKKESKSSKGSQKSESSSK